MRAPPACGPPCSKHAHARPPPDAGRADPAERRPGVPAGLPNALPRAQHHCMEMNWSSLLALVLLTYFCVSMIFTGVFLFIAVRAVPTSVIRCHACASPSPMHALASGALALSPSAFDHLPCLRLPIRPAWCRARRSCVQPLFLYISRHACTSPSPLHGLASGALTFCPRSGPQAHTARTCRPHAARADLARWAPACSERPPVTVSGPRAHARRRCGPRTST